MIDFFPLLMILVCNIKKGIIWNNRLVKKVELKEMLNEIFSAMKLTLLVCTLG